MNMFLHQVDDAKIGWGDTLANPLHLENDKLMKFQVVVANPPFSLDKWANGFSGESNGDFKMEAGLDPFKRFDWGVPPTSKGDFAFVLHMLNSLSEGGRMAVVLPHGVLFRGGSEGKIRQKIVDMKLLDAVIGLPANLFYGVGIPAVILVFKQNKSEVLFIDASQDGMYDKDKNQNRLRPNDLNRIIDAYEKYETLDKYSFVATLKKIEENDYNLNIPRYVDTFEEVKMIDLEEVKENIQTIKEELAQVEEKINKYLNELGL